MALTLKRFEALGFSGEASKKAPELVLLHGWGSSSIIWSEWLETLRQHGHISLIDLPGYGINSQQPELPLGQLLAELAELLPDAAVLIGYSLGGMLATRLAQQFPEKIAALITLSSNVKFVADQSWPHAMAADVYKGFFSLVEKKSALALKRFSGFQCHGAQDEKVLIKKLRVLEETTPIADEVLTTSLNLLASIDNRDLLTQIKIPALYLLGEKDGLVPAVLASELALSPSSSVKVLANLPHCLFYADADLVWQSIETFLLEQKVLSAEKTPC